MSEYDGKSYPQRKVREMRAEIERLREELGDDVRSVSGRLAYERTKCDCLQRENLSLRARLGRAIEPGSEEARFLISVCEDEVRAAFVDKQIRQHILNSVLAKLRGEG